MPVALIPARGGSKRIPRKNIKDFCGRPIISWTIQRVIDSGLYEQVIVSTDDEEIASVAMDSGAKVNGLRPASLSSDHSTTLEVIKYECSKLADQSHNNNIVSCIYATNPLIRSCDLRESIARVQQEQYNGVVIGACRYDHPITRAFHLDDRQNVSMLEPSGETLRTQDCPDVYHDAGLFYTACLSTWSTIDSIISSARAVVVPSQYVQDIDCIEDWLIAEAKFRMLEDKH